MNAVRTRAFTLIELTLVVALLGLLAAFVWPAFSGVEQAEHLSESARRMQALVAMCRAEAMNQGREYQILIRADGSLRVQRQNDPLGAPDKYDAPQIDWVETKVLLDDVWVDSVQFLSDGPPPIRIVDEKIEFPQAVYDLTPVTDYEHPVAIEFAPDGGCNSLRWVLRDERGRRLMLTLDGRLGRVRMEEYDSLAPGEAARPERLPEAETGKEAG